MLAKNNNAGEAIMIKPLLEQWGVWARSPGVMLSYISPATVMYVRSVGTTVPSASITDDEACYIDSLVARLARAEMRRGRPEMAEALVIYYVGGVSLDRLAKALSASSKMKVSRTRADTLVKTAEAWIEGAGSERAA